MIISAFEVVMVPLGLLWLGSGIILGWWPVKAIGYTLIAFGFLHSAILELSEILGEDHK